jgi:hypothetical protein
MTQREGAPLVAGRRLIGVALSYPAQLNGRNPENLVRLAPCFIGIDAFSSRPRTHLVALHLISPLHPFP